VFPQRQEKRNFQTGGPAGENKTGEERQGRKKMAIELTDGGWGKLEEEIQEIENLARDGVFSGGDTVKTFQKIADRARGLRQTLKEVSVLVPEIS
jgi:hypothetical protein